ncbi:hypothetical protein CG747_45355 [Streptomyces sp. CB02959]|nr:hypothetical protein CG747_45355 [Streptomyces sp. CB02959]
MPPYLLLNQPRPASAVARVGARCVELVCRRRLGRPFHQGVLVRLLGRSEAGAVGDDALLDRFAQVVLPEVRAICDLDCIRRGRADRL